MKFGPVAFAALLSSAALLAHPHARVDQQAHLSIGRTEAVVTYYLAPTKQSGGHMFDHIDTDGDASLSRRERLAFAQTLIGCSRLSVDGSRAKLTVTHLAFPERRTIAAGRGMISVRTRAPLSLEPGGRHLIAFDLAYSQFGESWFVQPFYAPELARARAHTSVQRRPGSNAVMLVL